MERWGLEVFDSNGNLIIDDSRLLHRLWHVQEVFSANDDVTYSQPLDHEPTVFVTGVAISVGGIIYLDDINDPFAWEHKRDGHLYTGLNLFTTPRTPRDHLQRHSLIVVFARR